MTIKQCNILRVYHAANAEVIQQGLSWYNDANQEAQRLAELLPNKSVSHAAGVISALSPGLKWEVTIKAAERTILGESLDGIGVRYSVHKNKAKRIANGSNPDSEFEGRDRPKTRAFWKLISNPLDSLSVCIDVHAYGVWFGKRITSDSENLPRIRGRLYNRIAGDYITVARCLGILPHQLQAVTWLQHRHFWDIAPF